MSKSKHHQENVELQVALWMLSAEAQDADFIFANHHETQNTAKSDESLERLLFGFGLFTACYKVFLGRANFLPVLSVVSLRITTAASGGCAPVSYSIKNNIKSE